MRTFVLFLILIFVGVAVSTPITLAGDSTQTRPVAFPFLTWGTVDVTLDIAGTRNPLSKRTSYSFSRDPSLSFGWMIRKELRLGLSIHSDGSGAGVSAGFAYRF